MCPGCGWRVYKYAVLAFARTCEIIPVMSCHYCHTIKHLTRHLPSDGLLIMASDPEDSQIDSQPSIIRRSWQAILSPFSPSALATLPNVQRPARYLRADDIPATETDTAGERPTVRDYHSITSLPPQVRVPKKIKTSVKVEGKVWFANERS